MDAGQLTARIAAAMTLAQSGGHAVAADQIDAIRAELGGVPSYELAAANTSVAWPRTMPATPTRPWPRWTSALPWPARSTSRAGKRTRCRSGSSTWPAADAVATP